MALAMDHFITHSIELSSDAAHSSCRNHQSKCLLGGVDLLGENLLELLGCSLLDSLRDLAGAGGVADLASLGVGASVVDGVREFVLELGGSLENGVSVDQGEDDL